MCNNEFRRTNNTLKADLFVFWFCFLRTINKLLYDIKINVHTILIYVYLPVLKKKKNEIYTKGYEF